MMPEMPPRQILVTRPAGQAQALCVLIEGCGLQALQLPCLAIEGLQPSPQALDQALNSEYWLFTSRNAVEYAQQAFGGQWPPQGERTIGAVGQSTAKALISSGLSVNCVPERQYSSEALLAHALLQPQTIRGRRCSLICGEGGRELLAQQLQARGAIIDYLRVYRRVLPQVDSAALSAAVRQRQLAAATITSVESLHNLALLVDAEVLDALKNAPLIVVSERIAQAALGLGFKHIKITQLPADTAIVQAIMTCLDGENSGRAN
jgi:uroporphyrinogen-III synthase